MEVLAPLSASGAVPPETASHLPQAPLKHSDAFSYLAQGKFHRSFVCPRTGLRATYVDIGEPDGPPVLYFLPSGCSRYIAILLESAALAAGVRVVAMDRPGSGGTPRCELNDRVNINCELTDSLIEHLGLQSVALLACSGGFIHLLSYLSAHPERLSPTHPTVLLISPWVQGNPYLPYLPASIISREHVVLPGLLLSVSSIEHTLLPSVLSVGTALSRGASFLSSVSVPRKSTSREADPTAANLSAAKRMDHPYHEVWKLAEKYMWAEDQQGISQEHLLCLGKGVHGAGVTQTGSKEWMAAAIEQICNRAAATGVKLQVRLWWGKKDAMIPRGARNYLDELFNAAESVDYQRRELAGADHAMPMGRMDGMGEALLAVRARADEASQS